MAKEIEEAKPKDMPCLVEFVQTIDAYLDTLVDEHEVLKLVPWPDRYGVMREATKLFGDLMAIKVRLGTWRTSARTVEEELEAMEKFTGQSRTPTLSMRLSAACAQNAQNFFPV
ncbi:hypothetical protein BSKO_04015 [Bryopsis sp. KO-2023]|nr:hypothetical protein BSKO_04015 [Bryopsis sp. KO-2023]